MMYTDVKNTTQKAQGIIWDYEHAQRNPKTIWQAYGRPSEIKVRTYNAIMERAHNTSGYNHDLSVSGAGSHNYSTVYSYTENGVTYIVKDTKANTYRVAL